MRTASSKEIKSQLKTTSTTVKNISDYKKYQSMNVTAIVKSVIAVITMTSKLTETIPYRKTVWIKNFAKTVTTTTLISSGIGLIITGLSNRMTSKGISNVELQIGIISVITAIIIVTIIDKWAEKKKKEELEAIDKAIDERAEEIAEKLVLNHLKEIEENTRDNHG